MIAERARPWLPANALRDTAVNAALESLAQRWAARWFASPKSVGIRSHEPKGRVGIAGESTCWAHPAGGLMLAMSPTAHVAIAGGMLDTDAAAHKLSANDHAILRDVAAVCVRDFLMSAAPLFGLAPGADVTTAREANGKFQHVLSLGSASQLLELFADEQLTISARKALVRSVAPASPALASRTEAISRQTIQVGALVGVGHLGVGDLRSLALGDVLVLDRGPEDALGVAINGVRRDEAVCSIRQDGAQLKMHINSVQDGRSNGHSNNG